MALQTATNPETGEKVVLVGNQWVPISQTATNDKGQKAYLVNNQWLTEPIAAPKPEPTFMERAGTAATRGLEAVPESISGIGLGIKSALGMKPEASAQAAQIRKEKEAEQGATPGISFEELQKTYSDKGLLEALKKAPAYVTEQVLQSAPSMALPMAAGTGAAAISGPLAPIVGPLAGIGTYGLQQFGQFMRRQAEEGATGETLAPGKAATAAAVTAPIGYFADRLTLGLGKIPEKIIGKEAAAELAKRAGANVGTRAATGATLGVIAESPTEVLEQMAERWQAGLSLKDEDAMREYKEAFFGAAAVGGLGGAAGHAMQKAQPVAKTPPAPEAVAPAEPEKKPLAIGMAEPFAPRVFPDGSVATTPEDIQRYEEEQFRKKYEAQPADKKPTLALGLSEPFTPVSLPDGSVALTQSELDAYEQEQFEKKYAPQPNRNEAVVAETPPQLGYSPLPGVPKVTSEGTVLLTPEQEFKARYAPQKARITAEAWNAMTPEEKDAASVKAALEEQQRIRDAEAEAAGKTKKETGFKGRWTPEERAALGIEEPIKPPKPADRSVNPENIGVDNQLITEGAKPFADRTQAAEAAKLQPTLKPLKLAKNQGYVLTPKTQEELDREAEVAKQRAVTNVGGKAGEPLGAGQYIARYGGLNPSLMSDMNTGGNYQHGITYMFTPTGMTLERAKERLVSAGYVPEEATESEVIDVIKNNKLSTEGAETAAEKETKERTKAREREEAAANLKTPEAEEMGYPVTPQEIAQDYLDKVADLGIDTSTITEQAYEDTKNQSEDAYHDRVSKLSKEAIDRANSGVETSEAKQTIPFTEKPADTSNEETLSAVSTDGTHYYTTEENRRVEKELTGKTMRQVAKWTVDNAPNAFAKHFAQKAYDRIVEMERIGVRFGFGIATGKSRPSNLARAMGVTNYVWGDKAKGEDTSINIQLNGATDIDKQTNFPPGCSYIVVLHELLHVAARGQTRFLRNSDPLVKELNDLYSQVAKKYNADRAAGKLPPGIATDYNKGLNNAFLNSDELISWGLTDERMQKYLSEIKVGEKTAFNKLIELIRRILGIAKPFETALDRLVRTADQIMDISVETVANGAKAEGYSFGRGKLRATTGAQQSLFSKAVRESFGAQQTITPTAVGQAAIDKLEKMGRKAEKPTESQIEKARKAWDNAVENPKSTVEAAKEAVRHWNKRIQTWAFSSDAAINNDIREEIMESNLKNEQKIGALLNISTSQTVHGDALASLMLTEGNLKYNKEIHKWEAVKDDANFVELSRVLGDIAEKYGLSKEAADTIAHTAFEAKRLQSMVKFNDQVEDEVADMRAKEASLRKKGDDVAANAIAEKADRRIKDKKFIHMTDGQIADGVSLFKDMPELDKAVGVWNKMRENTAKVLVDTGLWSQEEAELMLENIDYVPFFREEQIEEGKGPKEYIRGLMVQAKEKRLRGSEKPVNDVFDNMARWIQYSVNRAVRNRSALALVDAAASNDMARKIKNRSEGTNVVRVWRDGKENFYDMADPMYVEAFVGLESIAIPTWKWAAAASNWLRQSVVMYPLFSVAQLPQDSFAAMFSSGLKARYALSIPARAAKEFLKTLTNSSATHEQLKKVGAVGVRDFTSSMARLDAEVYAGYKASPGIMGKIKDSLNHIAMASDNAVRQATYEAAIAQGLSRGEAIEKSFEIWNVRRKGTSKSLAIAGQVIPFFSAYLAAQNVALKTISGVGVSPGKREEAIKTLVGTTASVMTLSLLYAMMNGDDDDYLKKPAIVRDRLLMIPGTGGLSIPLRADLFSVPKIVTEHMYLLMTDKGYEDGRKFRDSMSAVLKASIFSPTVVPQAFKPLVEIGINYDFYSGRPLIGHFEKMKETERQFTDTTSELAKSLGSTGIMSPIAIDHILRGMFGSAGGLAIYMTNPLLHSDPNIDRPTMSLKDAMAALPGTSGFVSRDYESGLKNDFYVLRDEIAKVANTMSDLKQKNPEKIEDYLSSEEIMARYGMSKSVGKITKQLGDIRKNISQITNAPRSVMTADEKEVRIKELRALETDMLKAINTKELRAMAKL
jgi:Large polyvalent protein associated domain 38